MPENGRTRIYAVKVKLRMSIRISVTLHPNLPPEDEGTAVWAGVNDRFTVRDWGLRKSR